MIARALVSNPKVRILDEPTSGIDEASQEQLYNLLEKLNKEFKITIILVSHDFDKVKTYTNKIYIVDNHKVTLMDNGKE